MPFPQMILWFDPTPFIPLEIPFVVGTFLGEFWVFQLAAAMKCPVSLLEVDRMFSGTAHQLYIYWSYWLFPWLTLTDGWLFLI